MLRKRASLWERAEKAHREEHAAETSASPTSSANTTPDLSPML
jgi:hypothetical protein